MNEPASGEPRDRRGHRSPAFVVATDGTTANECVAQHPPWRALPASGNGPGEVTVVRRRRIETSAARAVAVVQHLGSLPVWERKALDVTVTPSGPHQGTYAARGRIAGVIPWRAEFDYELTQAGFHSWMRTPRGGVQVAGGFRVAAHGPDTCTIIHYEQYRLPISIRVLSAAWRRYVARTMDAELERVALLAGPAPVELHQHRSRPAATPA